ncbi:MmyB family transcriptional regulator [Streptomyces sp. NPDC002845]
MTPALLNSRSTPPSSAATRSAAARVAATSVTSAAIARELPPFFSIGLQAPRRAVLTAFDALPAPHRNPARYYLLDPQARDRVGDWERIAAETVAILRLAAGRYSHDRRLADLVGELTLRSPEFATWWNDHRVLRRTHGAKHYHHPLHPLVGDLHFSYESFQAPGDTDQTLCVYNVEPGSATAQALRLLDSWTDPQQDTPTAPPPVR